MLPFQLRNEHEIYLQAKVSGMFPDAEPSHHEAIFKQIEARQKLGDFSLMRERRQKRDDLHNARSELERQTSVMNTRLPHLRGHEARMGNIQRVVDDHDDHGDQAMGGDHGENASQISDGL